MNKHTRERYGLGARRGVFALIAALVTAAAIAAGVALGYGDADKVTVGTAGGSVQPSTTHTDITGDYTAPGKLVANDVLLYNYSGTTKSITLPRGSYKLETWGAAGGGADPGYGGYGAYMAGTAEFTSNVTLTITVGQGGVYQNGTQSVGTRAYGGGGGGFGFGGGGGGGTYIDIGSTPVIIAGGGGGAADTCGQGTIVNGSTTYNINQTYASGNGGYPKGSDAGILSSGTSGATAVGTPAATGSSGAGGKGGTQSGGGVGDGTNASYKGTNGSSRQGGDGNKGSTNSGGGGGGGYYGGGGGGGDTSAGGGGSSYYNPTYISGYSVTAPSDIPVKRGSIYNASTSGHSTGENGYVRITVIRVNQPPESRGASMTTAKRGQAGSASLYAHNLARDPDSSNTSGATEKSVYFTNGTSSNYDAFTTTANTGLYLNSSCSTLATKYFDWTWNSTQQFTITNVKMYPRNGVDGSTANGKITLYARVRDTFGTNTTRGTSVVSFTVNVPANTVSERTATVSTSNGNYYIGRSNTTTAPTGALSASTLYNPTANKYTAMIGKSLPIDSPFTIKAKDLLVGDLSGTLNDSTAVNGTLFNKDIILISVNNTSSILPSVTSRKYKIDELDAGSAVTAYNSSKTAIANAFTQLTFRCIAPDPTFQVLPVTLYVVETATAYGSGTPNVSPNITAVSMDIVFKMENSRPFIKSDVSNVVDVNVGESKSLALTSFFNDIDGMTASSHTITEAIVPANEFIQLDNHANVLATSGVNANYYNKGNVIANTTYAQTGRGDLATGFNMSIAYNATAGGTDSSNSAFMRYTYSGGTLTVLGLRSSFSQYPSSRANAPGHFYLLLHITDKSDVTDNGIWLPIAFRVGYNSSYSPVATVTSAGTYAGQSANGEFPTASGRTGDSFYFAPMAINYGGTHIIGKRLNDAGTALTQDGVQALGVDGDNFATATGIAGWGGKLNEFLTVSAASTLESIVKSVSSDGYAVDGDAVQNNYIRAEYFDVYIDKATLATAVRGGGRIIAGSGTADDNGHRYVSLATKSVGGVEYYVTNGVKLTLRSATMNRYVYATMGVTDTSGHSRNDITVAIRINNTSPAPTRDAADVAVFGNDYDNAKSFYTYDPDNADPTARVLTPTVTYKIPLGAQVVVTPYDFVSDYNILTGLGADMSPAGGFTLNGLTARHDPATGTLSATAAATATSVDFYGLFDRTKYGIEKYVPMLSKLDSRSTVGRISAGASGTAVGTAISANQSIFNDKLFFARSDASTDAYTYNPTSYNNFTASATNTAGYVTYSFGNKVQLASGTYNMDYILITATTRTAQPAIIELTVRDRYGNTSDCDASFVVRIVIDVINTAPSVKDPERFEELAVSPINALGDVTLSSITFTANGNGSETGLMRDVDNDRPEFIPSRGVLLANSPALLGDRNFTSFADAEKAEYRHLFTDDGTETGRKLTEYISASIVSRFELFVEAVSSTKALEHGVYIYFYVNDGNGGTSLGLVRVEVVNSLPILNRSESDGFAEDDLLWKIESTSIADITRDRYIVGSAAAAETLKATTPAVDADVRLIATDYDGLHDHVVLSPIVDVTEKVYTYTNLALPASGGLPADVLAKAVPTVAQSTAFSSANPTAAVLAYAIKKDGDGNTVNADLPRGYVAELLYYDGSEWLTADEVVTLLTGKPMTDPDVGMFFDATGRWNCKNWALRLRAATGMDADEKVAVTLALRDVAVTGGDTAGKTTSYASDRKSASAVNGMLRTTVYQSISATGIRTKDEYSGYDDTYVVEHYLQGADGPIITPYVSTVDNDKTSPYTAEDNTADIVYDRATNKLGEGSDVLKARSVGAADGTLAGTNSGARYVSGVEYDGAYVYPDIIEVPTATMEKGSEPVYVPMSFFGLLENPVRIEDSGQVTYLEDYVGYRLDGSFDRSEIGDIASAITLTDGMGGVWSGAAGAEHPLSDNPYITIEAFDITGSKGDEVRDGLFKRAENVPYYNNRLAISTTNDKGELTKVIAQADNLANFVGDGSIMYLEEQAKELTEHNFGLTFRKKNMRTGVRNLTLTIDLAKSNGLVNKIEKPADARTVTVSVHVENAKFDLSLDGESGDATALKYDETAGTYYVDYTMATASSERFMLVRRGENGKVESGSAAYSGAQKIAYTDADYDPDDPASYRDSAYFNSESFGGLSSWLSGESAALRAKTLTDDRSAFLYTSDSAHAQSSVANYFGVNGNIPDAENVTLSYTANGGMYGNNAYVDGTEGFSSYFTASLSDNGKVLNIMAGRKTFINAIAFEKGELASVDTTDQAAVKAAYLKRGLVAEYAAADTPALTPTRVYYPFKVLVFDNCGAGWMDGSYVGLELRITVTNAAPALKAVGNSVNGEREYNINLAVGNSITFNLYDFITDADIFVDGRAGYYTLATKDKFESSAIGIDIETGDYLDSPFKYDRYLAGTAEYDNTNVVDKGNGTYYRDGGGFTSSDVTDRDVIMWMETDDGEVAADSVPTSNNITFTVRRRTAARIIKDGKYENVSVDEYRFRLRFYDSAGAIPTGYITFVIHITNQTPRITALTRNFTMRAGDDLTVLTSYYDKFIGTDTSTLAYSNSATKVYYDEHRKSVEDQFGAAAPDGTSNAGAWKYSDITSTSASLIYDSTVNRKTAGSVSLGFMSLADDDTPWRLRVTDFDYFSGEGHRISVSGGLQLRAESSAAASARSYIALRITAVAACVNEPLTITVSDGEGGIISCVLYFTIVSSPPIALDSDISSELSLITQAGLEQELSVSGDKLSGVYRMFTVAGDDMDTAVRGFDGVKHAKNTYTVTMRNVARDPDGSDETNNMTLYNNGQFTVNGSPLIMSSDGSYKSKYFDIRVAAGGKSFTLKATGFNPDSVSPEALSFRIADAGNGVFENTLLITINVYTLYSDMINPTVPDPSAKPDSFGAYLGGTSSVKVKSYDGYYGAERAEQSVFAHLKLTGNEGNDGNTASPIIDPDVTEIDKQSYTVRLYALIDRGESSGYTALDGATLKSAFVRNADKDTFYLDKSIVGDSYLIGGMRHNGEAIAVTDGARGRLEEVNKYVKFEFGSGGASVRFTPVASTLDNDELLLYVEVEKYVSPSSRYTRTDAALAAGEVFKLAVEDSAPRALSDAGMVQGVNWAVEGAKGDSVRIKIYDDGALGAMFTDSDARDLVTIADFDEAAYKKAVAKALAADPDLDWDEGDGKTKAFTVNIDKATNELEITINRRMDKLVGDKYAKSVSFPLEFVGTDKNGKSATSVIMLTVHNTELAAISEPVWKYDAETGVGYSVEANGDGTFVIDAHIKYSSPLDIMLKDLIADADYSDAADTDSFIFADNPHVQVHPYSYLTDDEQTVYWFDTQPDGSPDPDRSKELATVRPIGEDVWHRTGIHIAAIDTTRTLSARTYIRVLDRASDKDERDTGVNFILNITVMNDAPYVIEANNAKTVYMVGAETGEPAGKLFFIGDYVGDNNLSDVAGDKESAASDTYLRIFSQQPRSEGIKLYSTVHDALETEDNINSSALFTVTIPSQLPEDLLNEYKNTHGTSLDKNTDNRFNQWFVITPKSGFYGSGAVDISVIDGDSNVHSDALIATFRINVEVLYNPKETNNELNGMTVPCSKSERIDIGTLIPELKNTLGWSSDGEASDSFSQSEFYELIGVEFQNADDSAYADLKRVEGTDVWQLTAGKQVTFDPIRVNVSYRQKSDPDTVYTKYFWLNVSPNKAPTLKYNTITFTRYDRTDDILHDLDDSNSIRLQAWQLFNDEDDPDGAALRMLGVSSKVSSVVTAKLVEDGRYIELNFSSRGESEITVTVTDETGTPVSLTFVARNKDLPQGSLWQRISASFEAHMLIWILVICLLLLLLIALVIIITVARKRKQAREELEALLVSELEIEEQMLKLTGGMDNGYQSFGYLPPSGGADGDQALLGGGADAPAQDPLAALPPPTDTPPTDGEQ